MYFNGVDLCRIGKPQLRIQRQPDPAPPAAATRQAVSLSLVIRLDSHDPATIQARLEYLQRSMEVEEGILRSETPGGHYLQWLARPAGDSLSAALAGRSNSVELNFTAYEAHPTTQIESLISAVITPTGGTPFTLHALRDFAKAIGTERVSLLSSARKISTTTINFTGRSYHANPADDPATRWAALVAQQEAIKNLNTRTATLTTGGLSRLVRISALNPRIDEARLVLDVDVQCFFIDLPGDNSAIADITEDSRVDEGSGETIISYTGTITAIDEALAIAKLDEIISAKSSATRRLASHRAAPSRTSGGDADDEEWTGSLSFTLEFREPQTIVNKYRIKSSVREDEGGLTQNISGEVRATTQEAALSAARSAAAALANGIQKSSEETLDFTTAANGTELKLVVLTFTYNHEGTATSVRGSIDYSTSSGSFSEGSQSISGSLSGPDEDTLRTIARGLIPSGVCLRTDDERRLEALEHNDPHTINISGVILPTITNLTRIDDYNGRPAYTSDGEESASSYPWTYLQWGAGLWALYQLSDELTYTGFYSDDDVATPDLIETWTTDGGIGTPSVSYPPPTTSFKSFSFTYGWFRQHTSLAIDYKDTINIDESTMSQERTIAGTIRAVDASAAEDALNAFINDLSPLKPNKKSTTQPYEVCGEDESQISTWIALDFSLSFTSSIAGTPGNDIIEASMSIQRSGARNRTRLHAIPFARPVAQLNVGHSIPKLTINAQCKARLAATARGWVQDKRAIVNSLGTAGSTRFESADPQEGFDISYVAFSGTSIATRTFTGRYEWEFTNLAAMDGIWQASMDY